MLANLNSIQAHLDTIGTSVVVVVADVVIFLIVGDHRQPTAG